MSEDSSKQAYAYTPGLKVKAFDNIVKVRKLPILGKTLVKKGDVVNHDTIIGTCSAEGDAHVVNGVNVLKVDPEDVVDYLVKKVGETINKGEILLRYVAFFGLSKKIIPSPADGTIEAVSKASGQIIVREHPKVVHLDAYVPGQIVEEMPEEGVVIQTTAAIVQGIFGVGGETHGRIKLVVGSPADSISLEDISDAAKGSILVGGSDVSIGVLRRSREVGAAGIVVGGIDPSTLREFLGEDIGVAITGQERLGLTLIVTEGFGRMIMSERAFELLKKFDGYLAHMNGSTQIRAGVQRPEIIIPHDLSSLRRSVDELSEGIVAGTPVRIIRDPYFGSIGKVVGLPIELQQLESESYVRVVSVELHDGQVVTVPRANIEIIEE